jgi:hypothetical protein
MANRVAGTRARRERCESGAGRLMEGRGVVVLAVCTLLAASAGRAQNLLPNAGFNTDIAGWTANYSTGIILGWTNLDAHDSSGSGSLQITNDQPVDNGGYNVFGICVPVTPGRTYHLGASYYFAHGQALSGLLAVMTDFYASSNCSTGYISGAPFASVAPASDSWQRLDTQPFVAPVGAQAAFALFGVRKIGNGGSIVCSLDDVVFELAENSLCYSSDDQLCLSSRFRVTAQWQSDTGSGAGHAVALVSDTGSFWFFSPANLEILVKVLDACSVNGRKWAFGGGLTNVKVVLTITDLKTSAVKTYTNPLDLAYLPIQDTSAFSTCP